LPAEARAGRGQAGAPLRRQSHSDTLETGEGLAPAETVHETAATNDQACSLSPFAMWLRTGVVTGNASKWILAGILILAAGYRLLLVDKIPFWGDEWYTIGVTRLSWPAFSSVVTTVEANMVLYYLALRAWLWAGDSEVYIRSFSLVSGVATVGVVYLLGSRLFSTSVGLIAALLMALNPFHIHYSLEARSYSMLALLVALSAVFFIESVRVPSVRALAYWVLFSVAAVYAQFLAILIPPAFLLSLSLLSGGRAPRRRFLAAGAAIIILVAPMVLFVLTEDRGQLMWVGKPHLTHLAKIFYLMAGGGWLLLAFVILCAVTVWTAGSRWRTGSDVWSFGFLITWLFVPIVVLFGISFGKPLFVMRYMIPSLVPLVLLVAFGLSRIRLPWLCALSILTVAALSGHAAWVYHLHPDKGERGRAEWKTVADFIAARASLGDAVVFPMIYSVHPIEYYWRKLPTNAVRPDIVFPANWAKMQVSRELREPGAALVGDLPARYNRVWVVFCRWFKAPQSFDRVASPYPLISRYAFPNFEIFLYAKAPEGAKPGKVNIQVPLQQHKTAQDAPP
jgi:Dolichyl-phosphate-mannose-protein mannosyltransferase